MFFPYHSLKSFIKTNAIIFKCQEYAIITAVIDIRRNTNFLNQNLKQELENEDSTVTPLFWIPK